MHKRKDPGQGQEWTPTRTHIRTTRETQTKPKMHASHEDQHNRADTGTWIKTIRTDRQSINTHKNKTMRQVLYDVVANFATWFRCCCCPGCSLGASIPFTNCSPTGSFYSNTRLSRWELNFEQLVFSFFSGFHIFMFSKIQTTFTLKENSQKSS